MHSVGNYYKMAQILANYSQIHVTFTFTGSLLVQLNDYVANNATDIHAEISEKIAQNETLTTDEKFFMLQIPGGFFDINWNNILNKNTRYTALKNRQDLYFRYYAKLPPDQFKIEVTRRFNTTNANQEYIDLAVLFNLLWIDPGVANADSTLKALRINATKPFPLFTRSELAYVLQKQKEIMGMVVSAHKQLQDNNQTEIVPSPYTHPIAPLLADFGWQEDLDTQVKKGIELYEEFFNTTAVGMWSPEMAVNEAALRIMAENGVTWTATDQNLLELAGVDVNDPLKLHQGYNVTLTPNLHILFRHTELSNNIGFTYAGKTINDAMTDFRNRILAIQSNNTDGKMVLTIALDGENPWESYANFGDDFLHALYANLTQLQSENKIRTITPHNYFNEYTIDHTVPITSQDVLSLETEDISNYTKYEQLPFETKNQAIPEGSWSGKDMRLRIWIGDKQENIAYMWFKVARISLMNYIADNPGWNMTLNYTEAMDALYRAEASDWTFWYGHDMGSPATFDPLFKAYLTRIYELIGQSAPDYLDAKFYPDGEPRAFVQAKPSLVTPTIDGVINSGEWRGNYTMTVNGEWMQKVVISQDYDNLYVAIMPAATVNFTEQFGKNLFIGVYTSSPRINYSPFQLEYNVWARYQIPKNESTLGFAIHAEVGIWFNATTSTSQKLRLSTADGTGAFTFVRELNTVAIDKVVEIKIPFSNLTLQGKDITYLAVNVAETQTIVDMSAQDETPIYLQVASVPEWGEIIFAYADPEGDDYGPGTYTYPTSYEFVAGVFDLLNFTVSKIDSNVMLKFQFKALGDNPWNGANGFCLQFIQVYIDKDGVSGSGKTSTFGARVNVSSADAWEIALRIGAGWSGSNVVSYANGTDTSELIDITLEGEDTVVAKIPISIIGEVNETWKYTVLIVSWEGYSPPYYVREIGVTAQAYIGGGADTDAVIAGVQPYVYDILAPQGTNQTNILSSYSISEKTYATVYAVGAEAGPPPPPPGQGIPIEYIIGIIVVIVVIVGAASVLLVKRRKKK
jgi:alpha-amylase/alpha-mannosidase (GH57 family)